MTKNEFRPADWAARSAGPVAVAIVSDGLPRGSHLPIGAGRMVLEAIAAEVAVGPWPSGRPRTIVLTDSPDVAIAVGDDPVAVVTLTELLGTDPRERGGRAETSAMLAVRPELVDLGSAKATGLRPVPPIPGLRLDPRRLGADGGWGDPAGASAEEGAELLTRARETLALRMNALAKMVLVGELP